MISTSLVAIKASSPDNMIMVMRTLLNEGLINKSFNPAEF